MDNKCLFLFLNMMKIDIHRYVLTIAVCCSYCFTGMYKNVYTASHATMATNKNKYTE